MKKTMVAAIVAVSVVSGGAAGGAVAYYQDFLLAPLAEQVRPDDGPAYELKRNTLRGEPCRWWLGFTC